MASTGGSGQFVTQQQSGQWLASKVIGTTVVSANNESIGDVNDVLMDSKGNAQAVIIGVGGFLGIGEKDVAVAFNALEFTSRDQAASNRSPANTTGSTSGSTSSTVTSRSDSAPARIMVRMTKQDLQNAPKFARAGDDSASSARGTTGTAPAAPGGTNAAPKQ